VSKTINIFLADNQILIKEGIKAILKRKSDFTICGEAQDSQELYELLPDSKADILVIDYHLKNAFSINDIKHVRKAYPHIGILVITTNTLKKDVMDTMNEGINSYILKTCDEDEIMSAFQATSKKEKFFCGKILDIVLDKKQEAACEGVKLTTREIEIVKHVAEGLSTKEISDMLYLSLHTVNTHRKNIWRKLEIKTQSELVRFAIKNGIIYSE
jgi:DNA-binding NarL/FixJ family response regulator